VAAASLAFLGLLVFKHHLAEDLTLQPVGFWFNVLLLLSLTTVLVNLERTVRSADRAFRYRTKYFMLGLFAIMSIVLAMLASGSRAPIVLATAGLAFVLTASGRLGRGAVWALLLYGIMAYGFIVFGPGVQDRIGSIASSEHLARFERTYFGQLFLPSLLEYPLGRGLGLATIGARHFAELFQVVLVESYLGILAVETGWPGLLAFVAVELAALQLIFRHYRLMAASPDGFLWLTLATYVGLTIAILPVSTGIDHAPTNFYFWFAVGAIIRLVEIEYWRLWDLRHPSGSAALEQQAAFAGARSAEASG